MTFEKIFCWYCLTFFLFLNGLIIKDGYQETDLIKSLAWPATSYEELSE